MSAMREPQLDVLAGLAGNPLPQAVPAPPA
jgi:hypothetical protein